MHPAFLPGARALSILQPWAWLIVNGHKDIENRVWRTSFRGKFYVHAGLGFDDECHEGIIEHLVDEGIVVPPKAELLRGAIVGTAVLVDCVESHDSSWFNGPCGFVLRDGKPCEPVRCRGMLNFFWPRPLP